jgi:hypothetical protein
VNDVYDGAGSYGLEVFDESACVASIRVRRVDALGGEVVESLEVGVHDYLLLVCVLERFTAGNGTLHARRDRGAALESTDISAEYVHEHRLGYVVSIVASHELVHSQEHSATIERLSPKHATEGAVVFAAHLFDNLVHGPAVQLLISDHFERQIVVELVAFDTLERVVAVTGDAFVNGEQDELDAVVMSFVELLEHIGEHGRVLATASTDADAFTWLEQLGIADCLVNLFFEYEKEALLAHGIARLGTL